MIKSPVGLQSKKCPRPMRSWPYLRYGPNHSLLIYYRRSCPTTKLRCDVSSPNQRLIRSMRGIYIKKGPLEYSSGSYPRKKEGNFWTRYTPVWVVTMQQHEPWSARIFESDSTGQRPKRTPTPSFNKVWGINSLQTEATCPN